MSEDLTKFLDGLTDALDLDAGSIPMTHKELATLIRATRAALATQPELDPVPELPEWLEHNDISRSWHVTMSSGLQLWLSERFGPDDLDRIAEACTKLAARERARRAGS